MTYLSLLSSKFVKTTNILGQPTLVTILLGQQRYWNYMVKVLVYNSGKQEKLVLHSLMQRKNTK